MTIDPGAIAEMLETYNDMLAECEVTHSGHLRRRDEGRIIASLRHRYTNYESCLHLLTDELAHRGIDAQSAEAEEAHRIIRRAANSAVYEALNDARGASEEW